MDIAPTSTKLTLWSAARRVYRGHFRSLAKTAHLAGEIRADVFPAAGAIDILAAARPTKK
jgi:hypothetical protein